MQVNGAFHGIEKTCVKAYDISVYGIDFSSDEANKAMIQKNKHKRSIKGPARPGPRIVVGNNGPTGPAGRAWARAENLNSSA